MIDAPVEASLVEAEIKELRDQVAPGLFAGFNASRFPTSTLPALSLAARAYGKDLGAGEKVSFALRDAMFEQGLDISDAAVLEELSSTFGLGAPTEGDRSAVLEDWHGGQRRAVRGSPHFFCNEHDVFCPSLDVTRDPDHRLQVSRDMSALDAYLDACFS